TRRAREGKTKSHEISWEAMKQGDINVKERGKSTMKKMKTPNAKRQPQPTRVFYLVPIANIELTDGIDVLCGTYFQHIMSPVYSCSTKQSCWQPIIPMLAPFSQQFPRHLQVHLWDKSLP